MDQEPDPESYINLTGDIDQTVLTYDPILMGSVQPVPPPPAIKPLPPSAPPPVNATIYNPIKDVNKFTNDYNPTHNEETLKYNCNWNENENDSDTNNNNTSTIERNSLSDDENNILNYNESIWDSNGQYKLFNYNKFNPFTGEYEIGEPPNKKRKIMNEIECKEEEVSNNNKYTERYSLTSLGFQPLEARAIIEQLDSQPKLRYCEEFSRDINRFMELETHSIINRLDSNNISNINEIFPTSNGLNKNYLYTECGINPNNKLSINKLRAHLLSKSINTMIYSKQKQIQNNDLEDIDIDIVNKNENKYNEFNKKNEIISAAQKKSLEIARKLGFIPQFLKENTNTNENNMYGKEDGEIRETDAASKKLKLLILQKKHEQKMNSNKNNGISAVGINEIESAKQLLNFEPPLQKKTAFTQFECKSVLKCDGSEYLLSEYNKFNGSKIDISRSKYDSNFRPQFPITNKNYKFKIVSKYGFKLLNKYGYKCGDGLGRNGQGVTTFPRITQQGQNSFKGINYGGRNRKNLGLGFIHCIACDKSFCGYQNLLNHISSKKHIKNLLIKPNNLVLLCVQCQIQFPGINAQKIKEHYMLVEHNKNIPGINAFQKQLKHELIKNQIKYIQNIKHQTPNTFDMNTPEPPPIQKEEKEKEKVKAESPLPNISLPLPNAQQQLQKQKPPIPMTHTQTAPAIMQTQQQHNAAQYYSQYYNNYYANYYANYNNYNGTYATQYYNNYIQQQQQQQQQSIAIDIPINTQICNDIKHKIYTLGLKLPMAVPTVPWIYCPSCGSFYTTFIKFNNHYQTQRHINSINKLNETDKKKMSELFLYIQQKQQQYANQSY